MQSTWRKWSKCTRTPRPPIPLCVVIDCKWTNRPRILQLMSQGSIDHSICGQAFEYLAYRFKPLYRALPPLSHIDTYIYIPRWTTLNIWHGSFWKRLWSTRNAGGGSFKDLLMWTCYCVHLFIFFLYNGRVPRLHQEGSFLTNFRQGHSCQYLNGPCSPVWAKNRPQQKSWLPLGQKRV